MARTKNRAIPAFKIKGRIAIIYACLLGMAGFSVLGIFTNWLVFWLGLISIIFYVVIYGIGKRRTVHGTLIGTVPGAMPPVAGYLAVTGRFDSAAIVLFLILVFWQMPHFYAIAMYRYKDYKAAGLPVLPVIKSMRAARHQILAYIVLFTAAATLLTAFGYTGYIYLAVVLTLGLYWLWKGLTDYSLGDELWGKKMFLTSLIITIGISIMISFGSMLP